MSEQREQYLLKHQTLIVMLIERTEPSNKTCSRFALIEGGTPAVQPIACVAFARLFSSKLIYGVLCGELTLRFFFAGSIVTFLNETEPA
jgi:hypothetical protein